MTFPLLKTKEAAALLGIAPNTLRTWTRAGVVPDVKLMGAHRYERPVIEEFARRHDSRRPTLGEMK